MTQVEALPPFDFGGLVPDIVKPFAGRVALPWTTISCPTCHAAFHPAKVAFRCMAEPAVCPPEPDTLAGRRLGRGETPILPRAFAPEAGFLRRAGARLVPPRRASCDLCGTASDHRVCPACHAPLPKSLGAMDVLPIVVAGARGAGKSTWLAVVTERLESGAGAVQGAAFWPEGDWAERRIRADYRDPLFLHGRTLPETPPAARNGRVLEPLFERFDRRGAKSALLALHDTSGADAASDGGWAAYAGATGRAAAIALLIAPEDLPAFGGKEPRGLAALGRIVAGLEAAGRAKPDGTFDTPLAIVLAKLDRIAGELPAGIDMLAPAEPGAIGAAPASDEVSAYLAAWGGGAIPALVRARFPNHAFFAMSALGRAPAGDAVETPKPFRAEEAMLWILGALGRLDRPA